MGNCPPCYCPAAIACTQPVPPSLQAPRKRGRRRRRTANCTCDSAAHGLDGSLAMAAQVDGARFGQLRGDSGDGARGRRLRRRRRTLPARRRHGVDGSLATAHGDGARILYLPVGGAMWPAPWQRRWPEREEKQGRLEVGDGGPAPYYFLGVSSSHVPDTNSQLTSTVLRGEKPGKKEQET
jgi:hypothetical protein